MATELAEWLKAQLDDDERAARFALFDGATGRWTEISSGVLELEGVAGLDGLVPIGDLRLARHMELHDPARVLAEVEAKRQILDLHAHGIERVSQAPFDPATGERLKPQYDVTCFVCGWVGSKQTAACRTLRLLAFPYRDKPGYLEEWAPQ